MDTQFRVFEVLRIAEEVETKAAKFYLRSAERLADAERRRIYYHLAEWRAKHRNMWKRIRRRYSGRTGDFGVFDPDNYVLSNPGTMAGLTAYGTDLNGYSRPTGCESREQILQGAIRRSRDIIIFYHGLKEFACRPDSRMMIDNLISEERRHIHLLALVLERTRTPGKEQSQSFACCAKAQNEQ
jgi:rubrerythrin